MDFFSSPIGVAIAWITSVLSFIWGFVKHKECNRLKISLSNKLEGDGNSEINQSGEKNVNVRDVSGGMKIKM